MKFSAILGGIMPRLKPSELAKLELEWSDVIFYTRPTTTLSQKIFHDRVKEEISLSGMSELYEPSFLNDDHRNSVSPAKAIWPWPVPKDESFDEFWEVDDFLECYPMSSVRPPLDLSVMTEEAEFTRRQHDHVLEEFQVMDEAEAYSERLRNFGI